jgi:threonylcarbamoyladenosine tRNA methylthiotransferase MtaB
MSRKFYIATFGCRTNQADSAAIREDFLRGDFEEAGRHEEADVIVVNSCTVTHRTDQQVRQLARRLIRGNPSARVLVTGCYAQRAPERLAAIPGVAAVVGNTRKDSLVELAGAVPGGTGEYVPALAAVYRDSFEKVRVIDAATARNIDGRTRAFVKIQDGCDAKCSYCVIPTVRGFSRSVPPEQVLDGVRRLIDEGFREIVLTGIHIGTYGQYLSPRFPLDRLLRAAVELPGLGRLRISSIEPMELSRRVIELAASSDRIAPHYHICLQSGSDRVLRRMLRPYNAARFLGIVEKIREAVPHAAIGTDVIVGFPGESEEDHRATVEFLAGGPFTYLHVFPYSDRPGTAASRMPDKVRAAEIRRRGAEIRRLGVSLERAFRKRFLGESLEVLTLSEVRNGRREAVSGNYLRVLVPEGIPENTLFEGRVIGEAGAFLVAEPE